MNNPIARRDLLKSLGFGAAAMLLSPVLTQAQTPANPPPPISPTLGNGPFTLPELGYPEDALEPHLDALTMGIHRTKHQQAYVTSLNNLAKEHPEIARKSPEDLIRNLASLDEKIRLPVRNNAGGWYNHTVFWQQMKPGGAKEPGGQLAEAIQSRFGGVSKMQEAFNDAAVKRFGSGWAWLVVTGKSLEVVSTANQDNPLMGKVFSGAEGVPILGCDVWEHAYYLRYQNRRPDYLKAWWNVVNWSDVRGRFDKAMA